MATGIGPRTREIIRQEAGEMMLHDPITGLPLVDPVIDPCGHTFNKSTVKRFEKTAPTTVRCPYSRRTFNPIVELIPNRYAKDLVDYVRTAGTRPSHSGSSSSSSSSSTTSTTTSSIISTQTTTEVLETVTMLTKEVRQMREAQKKATAMHKKEFEKLQLSLDKLQLNVIDILYQVSLKNKQTDV